MFKYQYKSYYNSNCYAGIHFIALCCSCCDSCLVCTVPLMSQTCCCVVTRCNDNVTGYMVLCGRKVIDCMLLFVSRMIYHAVCMHTCAHTCSHAHTHKHSHTHTQGRVSGCRMVVTGTNQALWASAGKSTWGRASAPQVRLNHAQGDVMVWAPKVPPGPHPLVDMDSSLTFASPVITRSNES